MFYNIVHIALVEKDTEWFTYAMFIKLCPVNRWHAGTHNYFLGRVALTTTQATESSPMHESSALQFSYNNSQLLKYSSSHSQCDRITCVAVLLLCC